MAPAGPKATPILGPPPDHVMTAAQWEVFLALVDGALPSFVPRSRSAQLGGEAAHVVLSDEEYDAMLDRAAKMMPAGETRDALDAFMMCRPSESADMKELCGRRLAGAPGGAQLGKFLDLLNTRLGSLLFTGYWDPITAQPAHVRQAIVRSWITARTSLLRSIATAVTSLAANGTCAANPLFFQVSGYRDTPPDWTPAEGYPFEFIHPENSTGTYIIKTDVVVVGSGPGGAVCAKNLSEKGHRVVVLDKGHHFPPDHFPMNQKATGTHILDGGGAFISEGGEVMVTTGSTWGGAGTVNWSVCLRTQDFVREEWASRGLPMFASEEYDACMDRVWEFVGATTEGTRHNPTNNVILDASRKLGWRAAPVARNTRGKEHYCGRCFLGCGKGEKMGPAECWLPAAAEAGARFMQDIHVEKVLFGEDGVTAKGVEGVWTDREDREVSRRVRIMAKKVIVAGGSLRSPLLLKESGVENPHIGQNLHLHPATPLTATFDDPIEGWEGGIITCCNSEFENLDGKGHGAKLETTCMVPAACLPLIPWRDGLDAKLRMARASHLATFISITRDRDTGHVYADPETGRPRIEYDMSPLDRDHAIEGIVALSKICYVSGAREILPHVAGVEPFVPDPDAAETYLARAEAGEVKDPEFADARFARWLRRLHAAGSSSLRRVASAHQMGTCRMAARREDGVVDENGKVWGREGLYVADASVFPSASGVNPMVTVMAIADWISRGMTV